MAAPTGKGNTRARAFRLDDDLYAPCQAIAALKGETLTDVVRQAFEQYKADNAQLLAKRAKGGKA